MCVISSEKEFLKLLKEYPTRLTLLMGRNIEGGFSVSMSIRLETSVFLGCTRGDIKRFKSLKSLVCKLEEFSELLDNQDFLSGNFLC